jgi:hypothetical protein
MADSLESALSSAFADAPAPKAPPVAAEPVVEAEAPVEVPEGAENELAAEPAEDPAPAVDEPEFEVEVDGAREVIRGSDKVKEILQKGLHYTKNSEAVARDREALVATAKQQQTVQVIQNALAGDISELRAYDQALEQWSKVDWNAAFDADPFNAFKLKEQRDQLREARAAKFSEFQHKAQQADAAIKNAGHQRLVAEEQALLAKLPEWRNSEKALAEAGKIKSWLANQGYSKAETDEIGDHRHLLIARKAYLYDQFMAGKDAKLKQVRDAPQTVRPGATQPQTNGRVEFSKAKAKIKELGTKGNHRAQENLATQMFERAFK